MINFCAEHRLFEAFDANAKLTKSSANHTHTQKKVIHTNTNRQTDRYRKKFVCDLVVVVVDSFDNHFEVEAIAVCAITSHWNRRK